jgi:hypothetical protein
MTKSDGIDNKGKRRRRCRRCSEMRDARCAIISAERLTPRKLTNGRLRYTIRYGVGVDPKQLGDGAGAPERSVGVFWVGKEL